jgi:adenylate cyclase
MDWTGTLPAQMPTAAQKAALDATEQDAKWIYALALLALLAARQLRAWHERRPRKASIELRYPDRTVRVPRGWSVLVASRAHGIAHLSVCGGRARCSTCRVRALGPASHVERRATTSTARWSGCVHRMTCGWHASFARTAIWR